MPGRLLGPVALEPVGAALDDVRHVAERLDVVDDGRRLVQALHGRERRAQPRLAAEPLERVEQRGLLTADVRAGAAVQHDVEVVVGAEDALARVARPRRPRRSRVARPCPATGTRRGSRRTPCGSGSRTPRSSRPRASGAARAPSSSRLLHVPGSDSSKFTVTYVGLPVSCGTNDHFMPVGKPAPPRPRRPESFTTCDHVVRRHLQRQAQPGEAALRLVAGRASDAVVAPVRGDDALELRAHASTSCGSRPANSREAARKSRIASPRDGAGTSPALQHPDQLAHPLRRDVVVVREVDLRRRAPSRTHPRHSSSWSVMTPVVGELLAVRDPGGLMRGLVDLGRAAQRARQVRAHRHHVRAGRPEAAASCRSSRRPRPRPWSARAAPRPPAAPARVTRPSIDCAR